MITVCNPSLDPFYNQAFEEYVFERFREDDVFLLWRNAPAVIVGSYQNICREVRIGTLRRLGIPVVRRMTGGGTVYHDLGNLNYTLITTSDGSMDYDRCILPIVSALRAMGIPAEKSRVCDVTLDGKKISGSAQRVAKGRVLHHGTLLFSSDLALLNQLTANGKDDGFRTKGTLSDVRRVTNIREHLVSPMTFDEFQTRLLAQMIQPDEPHLTLTPEQDAEVRRLRDEKYKSWEWTWGRTPAFVCEREGCMGGAPIRVSYRAKQGVVSDVRLESPLVDGEQASALLEGSRLDPDFFAEVCRRLEPERSDELFNWLM